MKQVRIEGQLIQEYSDLDREIQLDLEDLLNMIARAHNFNWTCPTHDIVRRLMNEVHEFKPVAEEEL